MTPVAMLGPSLRLIVLQFLMPNSLVPDALRPKRPSESAPITPSASTKGKKVMQSTPKVYLLHLLDGICPGDDRGPYELVDAWFAPTTRADGKYHVRYVLCHKEHVKPDELFPDFVANRDELMDSLINLAGNNLWAVQGYLNPYLEKNGKPSDHQTLMLDCASRQSTIDSLVGCTIRVYRDGRDELGKGLGPKIPMTELANMLHVENNEVVLELIEPAVQAQPI